MRLYFYIRFITFALICSCLVVLPPATNAQPEPSSPETARQGLALLEKALTKKDVNLETMNTSLGLANNYLEQGEQCLIAGQKEMELLTQSLATLGPATKNEAPTVIRERRNLSNQQSDLEKRLGECRLLTVKAKSLSESLVVMRRQHLSKRLLHQQPDIFTILRSVASNFPDWSTTSFQILDRSSGLAPLAQKNGGIIIVVLLAGAGLGIWLRHRMPQPEKTPETSLLRLAIALRTTTSHCLPWLTPLIAVTGLIALLSKDITPSPCLPDILIGLSCFAILHLLIKAILRPTPPATPLSPDWAASLRGKLHRRLLAMGLIVLAIILCDSPLSRELPAETMLLAHNLLFTLTCLLFLRLALALTEIPFLACYSSPGRTLVIITVTIIAIIEWLGFHNLAFYLGRGLLATLLLAFLAWGGHTILCQLFYMLAYGRKVWRQKFGSSRRTPGEAPPSIAWAQTLTAVLTWSVFTILLIQTWRISDTFTTAILTFLQEGFKVGDITIVPTRIISGLLLFTTIWTLSSWLRNRLEKEWLVGTHLARSARDALVTVTGYLGFTFATVFGLAAAGVNFTSLAVIAGALSVGIGFGLQNIVNNFVSGLILLFEQPIKRGDWIRVGDTEGYVRKISVRSTIIQTFDRADVIVPNSDLISTPVTNLMLQDRLGRIKVSVGVAYGSDTALVKKLLEELATNHPLIISDASAPEPQAIFLEFGDSSLNFELRCFIHDVNQIFVVRSDINFAIDAAFRANHVEIPFPQRDLHVINLPKHTAADS